MASLLLSSKNSLNSTGEKWEIECAKEEGKKVRGIWARTGDRTELSGVTTYTWSDDNVNNFIDTL